MTIDFIKFWIEEVISLKIQPFYSSQRRSSIRGDLISFDNKNFESIIESNGYELVIKRDKYPEPYIQKYEIDHLLSLQES